MLDKGANESFIHESTGLDKHKTQIRGNFDYNQNRMSLLKNLLF